MSGRFDWAVAQLRLAGTERVLELGHGHGVALTLVCAAAGDVTGLDRSATMTAAAAKRNADHVASGRLTLVTGTVEGADLGREFDVVFGINVGLFWRGDPAPVRRFLGPGGRLFVFHQPPPGAVAPDPAPAVERLTAAGFAVHDTRSVALARTEVGCIEATAHP